MYRIIVMLFSSFSKFAAAVNILNDFR